MTPSTRRPVPSLLDPRGSALVGALMLVFVMTILGLALFDIARLDSRLQIDSRTMVQAIEVAEAGIERGLHLFYLQFVCGPTSSGVGQSAISPLNCANPPTGPTPGGPNYIIETCNGAAGVGCLARVALTVDCPEALLPDGAAGFKVLKENQTFGGGTYTVCVRPHPDTPTNQLKAQFRSRGILTSVAGTISRIVQIDATAIVSANKPHSPFAIGGAVAGAFQGNALIAGSLHFVSCPGTGCVAASFGGGGGMQNNYSGLTAALLSRIPSRYQDGTLVNNLGAVLKVKEGQIRLTASSSCIGRQESGSGCPGGTTAFQDTMSAVYTSGTWGGGNGVCAGGLNGATTTNRNCNVWTSAQGPYPANEPTTIPLLSDSTIIGGIGYRCFFSPPGATCPNTGDPVPGGTNFPEYFYSGAWRIDASRGDDGCDIGTAAQCATVLTAFETGSTPDLGAGPVTSLPIKPAACARQGGASSAIISNCTLRIAGGRIVGMISSDPLRPAEEGIPIRPDLEPINVYLKRLGGTPAETPTLKTSPVDPVADDIMYYRGKVMILADNPSGTTAFQINHGLLSEKDAGGAPTVNQSWCSFGIYLCGYAYPANHFLGMFGTGSIKLGAGGSRDILGSFFAANTAGTAKFFVDGGIGNTHLAGAVSANQFDFTLAGGVPKLYQAPWNMGVLPGAAGPAAGSHVSIVSANWVPVD
jgi:hypothetical protein